MLVRLCDSKNKFIWNIKCSNHLNSKKKELNNRLFKKTHAHNVKTSFQQHPIFNLVQHVCVFKIDNQMFINREEEKRNLKLVQTWYENMLENVHLMSLKEFLINIPTHRNNKQRIRSPTSNLIKFQINEFVWNLFLYKRSPKISRPWFSQRNPKSVFIWVLG